MLVFFVALVAPYLIIGMIINSTFNGKEGKEMIPNYYFWAAVVSLIGEGFRFTLWSCSKKSTRSIIDGYQPMSSSEAPLDPKTQKGYNTHI